ncbi:hypothetical protein GF358_00015 [Candidatus Woesearchaeota archaeon]|nr:hypothetical protein [Candidatus Woesearchaeota archaeon]
MTELGFDQRGIAVCLTPEIAYRIPESHAVSVQPKILAALSTKYNGQKPKQVLRKLTNQEKEILSEARDSFEGKLLAMQEAYLNKILDGPTGKYQHNINLCNQAVTIAVLEGIMQYQQRHKVNLLERIARFQKITGKDLLEQTE